MEVTVRKWKPQQLLCELRHGDSVRQCPANRDAVRSFARDNPLHGNDRNRADRQADSRDADADADDADDSEADIGSTGGGDSDTHTPRADDPRWRNRVASSQGGDDHTPRANGKDASRDKADVDCSLDHATLAGAQNGNHPGAVAPESVHQPHRTGHCDADCRKTGCDQSHDHAARSDGDATYRRPSAIRSIGGNDVCADDRKSTWRVPADNDNHGDPPHTDDSVEPDCRPASSIGYDHAPHANDRQSSTCHSARENGLDHSIHADCSDAAIGDTASAIGLDHSIHAGDQIRDEAASGNEDNHGCQVHAVREIAQDRRSDRSIGRDHSIHAAGQNIGSYCRETVCDHSDRHTSHPNVRGDIERTCQTVNNLDPDDAVQPVNQVAESRSADRDGYHGDTSHAGCKCWSCCPTDLVERVSVTSRAGCQDEPVLTAWSEQSHDDSIQPDAEIRTACQAAAFSGCDHSIRSINQPKHCQPTDVHGRVDIAIRASDDCGEHRQTNRVDSLDNAVRSTCLSGDHSKADNQNDRNDTIQSSGQRDVWPNRVADVSIGCDHSPHANDRAWSHSQADNPTGDHDAVFGGSETPSNCQALDGVSRGRTLPADGQDSVSLANRREPDGAIGLDHSPQPDDPSCRANAIHLWDDSHEDVPHEDSEGFTMIQYKAGDTFRKTFTTVRAAGGSVAADSIDAVRVYKNSVLDAAVVPTATQLTTGLYVVTFTIPTTYAIGTHVEVAVQATVDGVQEWLTLDHFHVQARSTDSIGGNVVTVDGPVSKRNTKLFITIIKGDDYKATDNRAIEIDLVGANLPADITGAAVKLMLSTETIKTAITGSIVTATGETRVVRFEPTASETDDLVPTDTGLFYIQLTLSGTTRVVSPTEARGKLTVLERIVVP